MRATAQPVEGNKVKLSVQLDDEETERAVDAAFRKLSREVRVPGFRPGKVPRRFLEARVGADAIRQEALRDSLPDFYAQALRDTDVDAIATPEIDITSGGEDGPVTFDATVEVRPTVQVAGYQGLAVTLPGLAVEDREVDAQVDRLRDQDATLHVVGRPARDGDHVTIDIKAHRHNEVIDALTQDDFSYEVGSESIVPEVDEQLRGSKVGDILKFNASIGQEELSFQILVKDVKEKTLPEATDAWAADASEFDTLDDLRHSLRDRLAGAKRAQAAFLLQDRTLDALVGLVEEEPPETLVDAELERRVHDFGHRLASQGIDLPQYLAATGQTQEGLLADLRQTAATAVRADLALRAVAEAEGITVTDEDVDAEVARLATQLERRPERVRRDIDRADQWTALRSDVRKAKALAWLVDHVELVDEQGNSIDRAELRPEPQPGEPGPQPDGEPTPDVTAEAIPDETAGATPDQPSTPVES